MSIVRQTRACVDCGQTFKVGSKLKAVRCYPCFAAKVIADEEVHAKEVEAMPVPAWADVEDPFVNVHGAEISVGLRYTGKQPFRPVTP